MIYVISRDGLPLMPTNRNKKIRNLLKCGLATIIKRIPFTVQLQYETNKQTQPISLGVDAGSKYIGISATTAKQEVFAAEYEILSDIVKRISERRENRRKRRQKLRYRKPRWNNRISKKKIGWIPPSIRNKIQSHLSLISCLHKILPISNIVIEISQFNIAALCEEGKASNEEEGKNFWNVREYVLCRDGHICQNCSGSSKDKILTVHHIESRKFGGNSPNNLITLCSTCHKKLHQGNLKVKFVRGKSYRDTSVMNIMRPRVLNYLREAYRDVKQTYGFITKGERIALGMQKSHINDAYCISQNFDSQRLPEFFIFRKIRCHNRKIHKYGMINGGKKINNQLPFRINGFRLFDLVEYQKKEYFIFGRRSSGYFKLKKLDRSYDPIGSVGYRKLKRIGNLGFVLAERKVVQR